MSSLVKLAEDILGAAKALESHFQSSGLSDPSFDNDLVYFVPPPLQEYRKTLINKTDELKRLSGGTSVYTDGLISARADELTLRAIYRYKVASYVPLGGSCSYESLSKATGLSEQLLQRFVRHCMGNYIFAQTADGQVRHTAISRRLATDSEFAAGIGTALDEVGPAAGFTLEALDRFGESSEQKETGFALLNQVLDRKNGEIPTLRPIFDVLGRNPERGRRFGVAMKYYSRGSKQEMPLIMEGFDWAKVDKPGSVLVDLGGGHGDVSQFIAQHTRQLRFVVQDLADTVRNGAKLLPVEYHGRIEFEAHDFFQPQRRSADVFVLRWILHNWSDKYAVEILRTLVPVMKEGSRVLIIEHLMNSEPETLVTEKHGA